MVADVVGLEAWFVQGFVDLCIAFGFKLWFCSRCAKCSWFLTGAVTLSAVLFYFCPWSCSPFATAGLCFFFVFFVFFSSAVLLVLDVVMLLFSANFDAEMMILFCCYTAFVAAILDSLLLLISVLKLWFFAHLYGCHLLWMEMADFLQNFLLVAYPWSFVADIC
ncbi:hypothetical protein U1Q18_000116 [Sarracenia purpurea var. burkii]